MKFIIWKLNNNAFIFKFTGKFYKQWPGSFGVWAMVAGKHDD